MQRERSAATSSRAGDAGNLADLRPREPVKAEFSASRRPEVQCFTNWAHLVEKHFNQQFVMHTNPSTSPSPTRKASLGSRCITN